MIKVIFFQTIIFFFLLIVLMLIINLIYFKFYDNNKTSEDNSVNKNLISVMLAGGAFMLINYCLIKIMFIFIETSLVTNYIEFSTSNTVSALICLVAIISLYLSVVISYILNDKLINYYYKPFKVTHYPIGLVTVLLISILLLGRDSRFAMSKENIELQQKDIGILILPIKDVIEIKKTEVNYVFRVNSPLGIKEYFLPIGINEFMSIIEGRFEDAISKNGILLIK